MAAILLIEDELWLGETYAALLRRAGHQVDWCTDAYDAMEVIDQTPPDLIVLDMLLPWNNGLQLLHTLVSHPDLATIPIIIYSNALPAEITAQHLRHYGVVAVLDKAATRPQQLVAAVAGVVHA